MTHENAAPSVQAMAGSGLVDAADLEPAPDDAIGAGVTALAPGDMSREPITGADDVVDVELWLTLDATTTAPGRARAAVRASAVGLDRDELRQLELLVSELVGNSVLHAATGRPSEIRVLVVVDADTRHVAVTDCGPGFQPAEPPVPHATGGFGLVIVDRIATRWGTTHGGRRVWFELPRANTAEVRTGASPKRASTRRALVAVAIIAVCALAGVFTGQLIGNAGARPDAGALSAAGLVAGASPGEVAAHTRNIQAIAQAYRAALDPGRASDPCGSISLSAATAALYGRATEVPCTATR